MICINILIPSINFFNYLSSSRLYTFLRDHVVKNNQLEFFKYMIHDLPCFNISHEEGLYVISQGLVEPYYYPPSVICLSSGASSSSSSCRSQLASGVFQVLVCSACWRYGGRFQLLRWCCWLC